MSVPSSPVKERNTKSRYILACPFCGKTPEVMGSGEGQRGMMIQCITQGCVNPHTSYYDHDAAVRIWNGRRPGGGIKVVGNGDGDV